MKRDVLQGSKWTDQFFFFSLISFQSVDLDLGGEEGGGGTV